MTGNWLKTGITLLTRRIDGFLFGTAIAIAGVGLVVLYSATDASTTRVSGQAMNLAFALCVMWIAANVSPQHYMRWALPLFAVGVMLLVGVALFGTVRQFDTLGLVVALKASSGFCSPGLMSRKVSCAVTVPPPLAFTN